MRNGAKSHYSMKLEFGLKVVVIGEGIVLAADDDMVQQVDIHRFQGSLDFFGDCVIRGTGNVPATGVVM